MSQSRPEQTQKISGKRNISLSLRTRLVVFVLSLVLPPLIIIAIRDTFQTQQALTYAAEASLKSSAAQTASTMDSFIQTTLDLTTAEAQFSEFTTFLSLSTGDRPLVQSSALDQLNNLKGKSQFIVSCALVDTNGIVLLDTVGTNVNNDESGETYFSQLQVSNKPVVTAVTYSKDKIPTITFANKIVNLNGKYVGSLRVTYNSAVLQDVLTKSIEPATDASILLLDDLHIRMADSRNPELILKSVAPLDQPDYYTAVTAQRFLDIPREEQATNYSDFELALDNASKQPFFRADITPNIAGDDTIAVAFMKTQPWIVAYSRPTSNFLADIQKQTRTNIILIIAASILISFIATVSVRALTSTIVSLTKTANAISQGDLSARSEINSTDEIGVLASAFNSMTDQLQSTQVRLEQRVAERTTDLEISRQQSEKRARELQTISEISGIITSEQKTEILLPLVTRLVSERFDFYHVGIFLVDETGQWAVLQASNSEGGQRMLARGHKLEVGTTGIVGYVTKNGTPRIALDVGADSVFFNNPDLPATRSEMALPLNVRGRVIGALDVQSIKPGAFTDNDANTLSILADQIAISIENARLFGGTQNALAEVQNIYRQDIAMSWVKFAKAGGIVGYHKTLSEGKLINKAVDTDEIRQTMMRGNVTAFNADEKRTESTLVVPVKLRGQVIGVLNIRAPRKEHQWSFDEIGLVEAISERLALALENARLFEETAKRAERERRITDITTKIRSTTDPQQMIDTAIEELRQALGATHVEVVPQRLSDMTDK